MYCSKCSIVDIDELVLFKVFTCVYRRTCTVQRVRLCISSSVYCSKGLMVYIVERVPVQRRLMVYIVELVLFKGFNCVYQSNLYCSKCLIVYIVELVLFKVFNCVHRRTCTVQSVRLCISSNLYQFKGFNCVYRRTCTRSKRLIVDIDELVLFNSV